MPRTWVRSGVVITLPTCRRAQGDPLASSPARRMQTSSRGVRWGAGLGSETGSWAAIFIRLTVLSIPPFPDYNAQDVVARTLVRPPTGMPPGRDGRRGVPGLEPGPPGGGAGP